MERVINLYLQFLFTNTEVVDLTTKLQKRRSGCFTGRGHYFITSSLVTKTGDDGRVLFPLEEYYPRFHIPSDLYDIFQPDIEIRLTPPADTTSSLVLWRTECLKDCSSSVGSDAA